MTVRSDSSKDRRRSIFEYGADHEKPINKLSVDKESILFRSGHISTWHGVKLDRQNRPARINPCRPASDAWLKVICDDYSIATSWKFTRSTPFLRPTPQFAFFFRPLPTVPFRPSPPFSIPLTPTVRYFVFLTT